ncbi:MAG TPA: hypothetical protein VK162_03875 [Streptosporangiaceae bacterium]|nr:hypothetical protein [Streptosporangiaceae bacterium]
MSAARDKVRKGWPVQGSPGGDVRPAPRYREARRYDPAGNTMLVVTAPAGGG